MEKCGVKPGKIKCLLQGEKKKKRQCKKYGIKGDYHVLSSLKEEEPISERVQ